MVFLPLSCSWGVAQKHHSYKEYLAKANGLRPSEVQKVLKKKKTASSEEVFWSKVQVPWTTKTWDIRVRRGGTWEPAELFGKSSKGEPRSYIVRANDHRYRRNRKEILKRQETPLHEDSSSDWSSWGNNNKDPVADQLWPDDPEEFDEELTTATIHLPLS